MGKASFTPVAQTYRFYNDDGGEATSTPYSGVAENNNVTISNGSNAAFHLRWRVQETGGADGATTDDYGLQYQLNGTGGWTSITGATSRVRAYTSSQLTADGVTTNRSTNGISDGTGSFVAGEQEETNGVIEDRQLTADNFTEHVWALELVAADNSNGETLSFRMTLNGGNPGMTSSNTPIVTISKPVSVAISTVLGTGGVGSLSKTVSLALNSTGAIATGAVGSVSVSAAYSVAITTVLATGAVGNLVPSFSLPLTGEVATGSVGTVVPSTGVSLGISGNEGTAGIGSLVPSVSLDLSGELATGSVDSLSPSISVALSGEAGTGNVGTVVPSSGGSPVSLGISGNESTSGLGSLTPSFSLALSGESATGSVGTLVESISLSLSGVGATGSVGDFGYSTPITLELTGVSAIGYAGRLFAMNLPVTSSAVIPPEIDVP